ncbi:hypothetical protein ACQEU8_17295 [Streptomyces sp. CA-250714]|uniref:hypothetical protein n=1 Tax=Streptomyces sp. CA-250714 TaxID=3240060 RepID=UPI003D925977
MSGQELPPQLVYYCECYVNARRIGSFDAHSPHEALNWVRVSLITVIKALDDAPHREARNWLNHGQHSAARDLEAGKPHTLTLKQRTTQATWTVSPIASPPTHEACTHEARA